MNTRSAHTAFATAIITGVLLASLAPVAISTAQGGLSLGVPAALAQSTGSSGDTRPNPSVSWYDVNCSMTSFSFAGCANVALSWTGSWFIAMGGAVLRLAGVVFDILITRVIIDFKGSLDSLGALEAITTGWTVFRDFSNIFIIGIFTFIAISIILGLKEYGQKKLIANVLIVAVLINFSLLFTKTIIDASNFTAFVIYKQIAAQPDSFDISQAFLTPMKITSVWKDSGVMSDAVLRSSGSGIQAFAFGLVAGMLLIAVAAVLLYGSFLIISRAILFIFLMLTSALAFATYLLPSLQESSYGWNEWWRSLINAALFAPLLMLFLTISLSIVSAASSKIPSNATLGNFIGDPQSQLTATNGWAIIMLYLIGIGTLFLSFKLASSFAGKISGLKASSVLPATFGAALSRLGGIAGRNTIGRLGQAGFTAAQRRGWQESAVGRRLMSGLNTLQSGSFDAMTTKAAQKAVKGVGGFALGSDKFGKGGLVGGQQRKADAALERATTLLSRTEEEKARATKAAEARTLQSQRSERDAIKTERQNLAQEAALAGAAAGGAVKAGLQTERNTAEAALGGKEQELRTRLRARQEAESEANINEQKAARGGPGAQSAATRAKTARVRMAGEDEKIREVRKEIESRREALRSLDDKVVAAEKEAADKHAQDREKSFKEREEVLEKEVETAKKSVTDTTKLGQKIAFNRLYTLYGNRGTMEDDQVAQRVVKAARGKEKKENIKALAKLIKDEEGSSAEEKKDAGKK